jgi:outer membrane translocation and assembly module TamA
MQPATLTESQASRLMANRWTDYNKGCRGVAFVDAGNAFDRAGNLWLTTLKTGVGAGLRLTTPVGLFRVDFGVPLSRVDSGAPLLAENGRRTPRWYFWLGQTF